MFCLFRHKRKNSWPSSQRPPILVRINGIQEDSVRSRTQLFPFREAFHWCWHESQINTKWRMCLTQGDPPLWLARSACAIAACEFDLKILSGWQAFRFSLRACAARVEEFWNYRSGKRRECGKCRMDNVGISWTQFAPSVSTQKLLSKICIQSIDAEAPNKICTQSIDAEAPTKVAPKTSTQKLQQNLHPKHRFSNKNFTQNM